jgi:hypothetical protein
MAPGYTRISNKGISMISRPLPGTIVRHIGTNVTGVVLRDKCEQLLAATKPKTVRVQWHDRTTTDESPKNLGVFEEGPERVTYTVTVKFDEDGDRWTTPPGEWDWATLLDVDGPVDVLDVKVDPVWVPMPGYRVASVTTEGWTGTVLTKDNAAQEVQVRWDNGKVYTELITALKSN